MTQDTAILGTCPAASCQYPSQIQEPQGPRGKLVGHADLRETSAFITAPKAKPAPPAAPRSGGKAREKLDWV